MVHERRFNYYTLPDEHVYRDERNSQGPVNSSRMSPIYHCPYCQSALAQPVWMKSPAAVEQGPTTNVKEQSPEVQRMLQQFLNDDGQVDVQKMLQTIGQFADTVQQVSPVLRQINDLIKSFRT